MLNSDVKLDVDYIESIIQKILDKAHTNPDKRIIKRYPNDQNPTKLNFACPICGDSHTKMSMKRGHLHLKNLYYVCYNERETDSMFFSKFCKRFNIEIDIEKKMDIYKYLDNNWTYTKKDDFILSNLDKLINLEEFTKKINENKNFLINFRPIQKGTVQHKYLIERGIFNYRNIYEATYKITDTWFEPVIVMLNRTEDKLLSMQIRNLKKEKTKRIYKFVDFQECYNMIHPEDPLDEIEAINYNKMSAIFNILNVELEGTVHIFEGFLDSLFFPNSIALVGLDTDISMFKEEHVDIRFVLDNDEAGQKKSKQMIEDDHSVFLWKRLINDLSKGKGNKFKYSLEECKDINGLVQFYNNPNIYYDLKLDKYFARDQFDLIDM